MRHLRAGKVTRVGNLTLVPLFLVQMDGIDQPNFTWLGGTADVFAMVVLEAGAGSMRVLSIDSSELDVEALRKTMPDLDATLQDWTHQTSTS